MHGRGFSAWEGAKGEVRWAPAVSPLSLQVGLHSSFLPAEGTRGVCGTTVPSLLAAAAVTPRPMGWPTVSPIASQNPLQVSRARRRDPAFRTLTRASLSASSVPPTCS